MDTGLATVLLLLVALIVFLLLKVDHKEVELENAQAELAKYRKQRDSRGRFTK